MIEALLELSFYSTQLILDLNSFLLYDGIMLIEELISSVFSLVVWIELDVLLEVDFKAVHQLLETLYLTYLSRRRVFGQFLFNLLNFLVLLLNFRAKLV